MKFINIGGLRHSYKNFLKKVVTAGNSEEPAILAADSTVNSTKVVTAMCKDDDPDSCVIQVANIKENKNITITDSGIVKQTGDTAGKETEVFNTAGGTTDLSPVIKKVKYIKKERRNFFHKAIPISFCMDKQGNYNPQINGRYEDWYYSFDPVFKIVKGKKFRLFIGYKDLPIEDFTEVQYEQLEYWHTNKKRRINHIEKSEEALICNKANVMDHDSDSEIIPISFFDINDIIGEVSFYTGFCIKQVNYKKDTDVYSIYIKYHTSIKPTPWNKNLKWIGNKIECILPTSVKDVTKLIFFDTKTPSIFSNIDNIATIKYYTRRFGNSTKLVKRITRRKHTIMVKCKFRTMIVTAKYHHYNKQPSKFRIMSWFRDNNDFVYIPINMIKRVE